jgi:predicted SprT family Zn-dependent metalloprotease
MDLLLARKIQVASKLKRLILKAQKDWNTTLPEITIKFDLRGGPAGMACVSYDGKYSLRFNVTMMLNQGWTHLIEDTVPHEVAHLLGYHLDYGLNHGKEWKAICIALGGSGKRCHDEKVTFAKGSTFEYITTAGKSVTISQIRHKRIQHGLKYTWKDGSSIDRTCQFKKVA